MLEGIPNASVKLSTEINVLSGKKLAQIFLFIVFVLVIICKFDFARHLQGKQVLILPVNLRKLY